MAFPVVEATNTSKHESPQTSHTVALPTGIQAGDLLIVGFAIRFNRGMDFPDEWELTSGINGGNGIEHSYSWRRLEADGTEGASVTVVTDGTAQRSSHVSYRISGWNDIAFDTPVSGASTTPDSTGDAHAPAFAPADILWLATVVASQDAEVSTYPSNYGGGITAAQPTQGSSGVLIASAHRELNASSEDPGAYTLTSSKAWTVATIAIEGAAAETTVELEARTVEVAV